MKTRRKTMRVVAIALSLLTLALGAVLQGHGAWSALTTPVMTTTTLEVEDFGPVEINLSGRPPRGFVMLVADDQKAPATQADRDALVRAGLIVVTFDLQAFRDRLAKEPADDECHYIADDLKDVARAVQRKLGIDHYFFPIITGTGEGAEVAYAALAQAPVNTLAGAISVGFKPVLRSDRTYCFEPPLEAAGAGLFKLRPEATLPGRWRVLAPETERGRIEEFQAGNTQSDFVSVEGEAAVRDALVEQALQLGRTGERGFSELPVSIIRPPGVATALALIVSGDGGWRDIDKQIGEKLAARGIAVIGVDSLRYFWSQKSPAQIGADFGVLLQHYSAEFGVDKLALVGFSFGADVMPDVWPALPRAVRDKVKLVSLLSLGLNADFEITVDGFVGAPAEKDRPLAPLMKQLPLERTQCIVGKELVDEKETACTAPEFKGGELIQLDGGHHFDGDYAKPANAILRRLGVTAS
jgi:type IV secretory pathway VirJ component